MCWSLKHFSISYMVKIISLFSFLSLTKNTPLICLAGILAGEKHRHGLHGIILKGVGDNGDR